MVFARNTNRDNYGIWLIRSRLGLAALITLAVALILCSLPWLPWGAGRLTPSERVLFLDVVSVLAVLSALITISARSSLKKAVTAAAWEVQNQQFNEIRDRIRFFGVLTRACQEARTTQRPFALLLVKLPRPWSGEDWREKLRSVVDSQLLPGDSMTLLERNQLGILIHAQDQAEAYATCKEVWRRLTVLAGERRGLQIDWTLAKPGDADARSILQDFGLALPHTTFGALLGD